MRGITIWHILPSLYMILTTVVAIALAFHWCMSPLRLDLKTWPQDPATRDLVNLVYLISYLGGIPLLIIAQVVALLLHRKVKDRAALALSTGAIACFYGSMTFVLSHLR